MIGSLWTDPDIPFIRKPQRKKNIAIYSKVVSNFRVLFSVLGYNPVHAGGSRITASITNCFGTEESRTSRCLLKRLSRKGLNVENENQSTKIRHRRQSPRSGLSECSGWVDVTAIVQKRHTHIGDSRFLLGPEQNCPSPFNIRYPDNTGRAHAHDWVSNWVSNRVVIHELSQNIKKIRGVTLHKKDTSKSNITWPKA